MALSMTTDYAADTGDPSPYLRAIAAAGFTRVHWCHEWNTDRMYSRRQVERIAKRLAEFHLCVLDLHGSGGVKKDWTSPRLGARQAGVELVRNRIEMAARLGADVVVMHVPKGPDLSHVRRSLDELGPFARRQGVRIAIENVSNRRAVSAILGDYDPDVFGLCYDSGHGNLSPGGLEFLADLADRLIAIHLHDNDGTSDQHKLPFTGTVDWPALAGLIAGSSYGGPVSIESNMRHGSVYRDEAAFLADAFDTAARLDEMVERRRRGEQPPARGVSPQRKG